MNCLIIILFVPYIFALNYYDPLLINTTINNECSFDINQNNNDLGVMMENTVFLFDNKSNKILELSNQTNYPFKLLWKSIIFDKQNNFLIRDTALIPTQINLLLFTREGHLILNYTVPD